MGDSASLLYSDKSRGSFDVTAFEYAFALVESFTRFATFVFASLSNIDIERRFSNFDADYYENTV